ncbi:uncharacterized protein HMPREF1541_02017 [Cyphellophora europaea CBS 101466]|uniref:Inosine/uridine-preferring nucleoside hydrolase domain-containing protein n=1 Tax=Cyphellophora europaea (strain CBS 101466) TaxID=1220924 RepID=W2S4I3_CYPE1|nr:uncharacterized protein HMPREF1541_02017 [Cyphellophora europaea CBS 101466]ETN42859.1 hypothetical protein HMPREF1541_02017 [Cyphellophora europaea CBS 101466]
MAPKNRIIIDTDPGIDDILALLLALSSPAEELEVLLISLVRGNVDVHACLRNVVALFHTLEAECAFRKSHSLPLKLDGITAYKPLIAIGADEPLQDPRDSDFFHGRDGLGGIHTSHPHLSPRGEWQELFREEQSVGELDASVEGAALRGDEGAEARDHAHSFVPSLRPAHEEILRLLRENEAGTITLIAIGPMTNFAIAAAEDPETFLRAKEVVIMGGTVAMHGNVTPVAEFNVYADPAAAARVFALSGPTPGSVLGEALQGVGGLKPYPESLSAQATVVMLGLDITERHLLKRGMWEERVKKWRDMGSPLAVWMGAFMGEMLAKMERLGEGAAVQLHDPMCVWYVLTREVEGWRPSHERGWEDVRVECAAQWTRGMTVGDVRPRRRRNSDGERTYDHGNWLGARSGNRIVRIVDSPGDDLPAQRIMDQLFG